MELPSVTELTLDTRLQLMEVSALRSHPSAVRLHSQKPNEKVVALLSHAAASQGVGQRVIGTRLLGY